MIIHYNLTIGSIFLFVDLPSLSGADPGGGGGDGVRPPSQITITHARFYFYERPCARTVDCLAGGRASS